MKDKPLISVILPVFNGARYLHQAVQSILDQSYPDFELIIINDGSTDQTKTILNSFTDSRIKVITNPNNQGIVNSLNQGIKMAVGQYIARMDADDISARDRFKKQREFLEHNSEYILVGSFTEVIDHIGKMLYSIEQPTRDQAIKSTLKRGSCIAHGSMMVRKHAIEAIGGYSTDSAVAHAEDYDLLVRLTGQGKFSNLPEYLYQYREHQASISAREMQTQIASTTTIADRATKIIKLGKTPKFSVLMPTYNKADYIADAIESVLHQTFADWELVIIDDHSSDNTQEVVKKYLKDKRIIYLQNPLNLGKSKSRNRLVKESIAPIFGELDSDDTLSANALTVMYKAHEQSPSAGFIYSQFVYCDKDLNPIKPGFCRAGKVGETNLHNHYATAFRTYKREHFNLTSGFDVTLSGAEDVDLVYKMEEVSPIVYVDKILYNYRQINTLPEANLPGFVAHAKAKIYAYVRRKSLNTPNITMFTLIRHISNMLYSYLKT